MAQLPLANAIRALSMDAVEKAQSGHCGLPLGFADVATLLFQEFLKFDASAPEWPDRDRLVLSAGHGSMLLYSLLFLTGSPDVTLDEIRNFRQLGSKTPGHPEFGHTRGVETTTGPLGQGFANAVGMAMAERHLNARFGDDLVDRHVGRAGEEEERVEQHRAVAGRQDQAIAVRPFRVGGVELQEFLEQQRGDIGKAQRQAAMAAGGLFNRIHAQGPNGIGERKLGHVRFSGSHGGGSWGWLTALRRCSKGISRRSSPLRALFTGIK